MPHFRMNVWAEGRPEGEVGSNGCEGQEVMAFVGSRGDEGKASRR